MNGYRVEYTPLSQLDTLRGAWESLSLGDEMTYFQSFEWMRLMSAITPVPAGRVDAGIYAVYDADGGLSLLAPLWTQTPVGGGYYAAWSPCVPAWKTQFQRLSQLHIPAF